MSDVLAAAERERGGVTRKMKEPQMKEVIYLKVTTQNREFKRLSSYVHIAKAHLLITQRCMLLLGSTSVFVQPALFQVQ